MGPKQNLHDCDSSKRNIIFSFPKLPFRALGDMGEQTVSKDILDETFLVTSSQSEGLDENVWFKRRDTTCWNGFFPPPWDF